MPADTRILRQNPHVRKALASGPALDERKEQFLAEMLAGKSVPDAAAAVGYSKSNGYLLLAAPAVQHAMAAAIDATLRNDLAPLAMATARKMIASDKTTDGARTTLILGVLDRAGYSADRFKRGKDESGRDVTQMKADELRAEINRLQREIEGRAVDITPNGAPDLEQALEIYE